MELMKKVIDYQIQARDVDYYDIIKPLAILDLFQDIASTHATELGIGYNYLKEKGFAWIVLYQEFEILKIPTFAQNVQIASWPKPNGRLEFEREYAILSTQGDLLVKGISNWLAIDLISHKFIRSKEIAFPGDYVLDSNYPNKCRRKLDLLKENIKDTFTYQVQYDDLDHNGHMNNAKYISIIFNHYPLYKNDLYIYKVQISYIKETKYQDIIIIGHYKLGEEEAYIGFLGEEVCFECLIGVKKK